MTVATDPSFMIIYKGLSDPLVVSGRQSFCDLINNENFDSGSGILWLLAVSIIRTHKTNLIPVSNKGKGWAEGCSNLTVKVLGSSVAVGFHLYREIPSPTAALSPHRPVLSITWLCSPFPIFWNQVNRCSSLVELKIKKNFLLMPH